MPNSAKTAEINIHLRARPQDRDLIDQAAGITGANRSQFMLSSALKEARNVLLDQTTLHADNEAFQKILDWMDSAPSVSEAEGTKRLLAIKTAWARE